MKMFFHSVKFTTFPNYTSEGYAVIFNDSSGTSLVNTSVTLNKDISSLKLLVAINYKLPGDRSYDRELLKTSVDACRYDIGFASNFLIKYVLENLKNNTNYEFVCPVQKNVYFFKNCPIESFAKYIPRGAATVMRMAGVPEVMWEYLLVGKTLRVQQKKKYLDSVIWIRFTGSLGILWLIFFFSWKIKIKMYRSFAKVSLWFSIIH